MAINKIITEKTLNYIETLYLYTNLEQFSHTLESSPNDKYVHVLTDVHDTLLCNAKYLGESKGRMWYKLPNYRLGIMDYEKAKKANQFNVEIQYEQFHMFSLDPMLKGLDLPFGGTLEQYSIKRIDVTQIAKTPNDYLTNHSYISPYRTEARISNNGRTETVYLGNRSSGNVFRMYNKTKELKTDNKEHPMNYKKIEMFSKYFGDIENLYTFELELHRKYLKPTFGIDTLGDLEKVYKAYNDIVGKIRIYEDSDHNRKLVAGKHHDRIKELYIFTEYKELKRLNKKRYKPSEAYMVDKAVTAFNRYEDSLKEPLKEHQKLVIADKILSAMFKEHDEVIIEFIDDEKKEFASRIETLRDSQTDDLEVEAQFAFRKVS